MSRRAVVVGADGRLQVQCCRACGHRQYPPGAICRHCQVVGRLDWTPAPERGRVVAHTVVHSTTYGEFEPPYTIAVVELEPGLRVLANIETPAGRPAATLRAGSSVRVGAALRDGRPIPVFTLDQGAGS